MSVLQMHEISEANHHILNPFTHEKLMLLGEVCRLTPGMRQLDLCCGKGEMLCQWSRRWGIEGIGVDISKVFLAAAHERAAEFGVSDRIQFIEGDAGQYSAEAQGFDVVSCIGATWIGGGLVGTLRLMLPALKPGGLLLVGEPYWSDPAPEEAYTALGVSKDEFTSLAGTLDRIHSAGLELVEMVLANPDSWDRYEAGQWWNLYEWLRDHPDDPLAPEVRQTYERSQSSHLAYQRRYFSWGVFVMKAKL
ncbi:MAG: class I SAM-dependent methyltransferase [Anaerolineae bacterium]|nr:class I SAM-dependent methyltransferase [Anaerolineae bacterium]